MENASKTTPVVAKMTPGVVLTLPVAEFGLPFAKLGVSLVKLRRPFVVLAAPVVNLRSPLVILTAPFVNSLRSFVAWMTPFAEKMTVFVKSRATFVDLAARFAHSLASADGFSHFSRSMRTCVIFNPAAKGQKAERLRTRLDIITQHAVLKKTAAPNDARRLAAEAIAEGCDTVIAAGGDGTVNEVLNGIGDAKAFDRVRLGVLPLGTINVFALELGIPFSTKKAWNLIMRGRYTRIDLGWAEHFEAGKAQRRYFMQLAGAGLDARAIELVDWQQKKKVGPLAYVVAGWRALREQQAKITVTSNGHSFTGELALIGNGKFYGGRMAILPEASLRDGLLDVCVFPRVKMASALTNAVCAAVFGRLLGNGVHRMRAAEFTVTADSRAGFELDGEFIGQLPVKFGVEKEKLRVIVP